MYFRDIYKPIPLVYNLVLAMLWRHPENVELDKVKVVHYCAAVRIHLLVVLFFSKFIICSFWVWADVETVCFAGIKALEVHRERRQHAERRYKDVGKEMVGHLRRWVSRLQAGDGGWGGVGGACQFATLHCGFVRGWCYPVCNGAICSVRRRHSRR